MPPKIDHLIGKSPVLDLSVVKTPDFDAWEAKYRGFIRLSGLMEDGITDNDRRDFLEQSLTLESLQTIRNLGMSAAEAADWESIVKAMRAYVVGRQNVTVERRNFRKRKQEKGERFDDYLISLRELAKTCNFCNDECTESALRDQLVEGLYDPEAVHTLLKQSDLTLKNLINLVQAHEAAVTYQGGSSSLGLKALQQNTGGQRKKRYNKKPSQSNSNNFDKTNQPNPPHQPRPCSACGKTHAKGSCPAWGRICSGCGRKHHFAAQCRTGTPGNKQQHGQGRKVNALSLGREIGDPQPRVRYTRLNSINLRKIGEFETAPNINAVVKTVDRTSTIAMLPDTGSDICAGGPSLMRQLDCDYNNLLQAELTPLAIDGSVMETRGYVNVNISFNNKSINEKVFIFDNISTPVLSWKSCLNLGLLAENYPRINAQTNVAQKKKTLSNGSRTGGGPQKTKTRTAEELKQKLFDEFPRVFDGSVRIMPGEKFKIHLTKNAKPFCLTTPRTVPFKYRDALKRELDKLEKLGIIAKQTKHTPWCLPIVVVPKKDTDDVRMAVDFVPMNKYAEREPYPLQSPAEVIADINGQDAKFFTVMDAEKGYHQCPLDEESQDLTTFITPYGRYKYVRAPYGVCTISDHYNRRMYEAFEDIKRHKRIVDDVCAYDPDLESNYEHVREILQRCDERGITLSKAKFQFGKEEVIFGGYKLSKDGYSINPKIINGIQKFPTPKNRTELRSFIGLAQQMSNTSYEITSAITPLRPLLSTKNNFYWDTVHDEAFAAAKEILSNAPTVAFFDPNRDTRIITDASRIGLGFVLQQYDGNEWKSIQAGSRCLTDTETRYAVVELEMLAVVWAMERCRIFVAGGHTEIITDHNPIVPIINGHRLDEIENPRLQRLRRRLMPFQVTAKWIKGSTNLIADALSRFPSEKSKKTDEIAETEINGEKAVSAPALRAIHAGDMNLRLQEIKTHEDKEYRQLRDTIKNGFPATKAELPEPLKKYWGVKQHLTIDDEDFVLYGHRLLIPISLQPTIIERLHGGHSGIRRTLDRARMIVYWPNMDEDVTVQVENCKFCQDRLPKNQPEPMQTRKPPLRPFQHIAADFAFHGGHKFLVIVDCFSDWIDVIDMGKDTTAEKLVEVMAQEFVRTAVPDVMFTDGERNFDSNKFRTFLREWGCQHITSSPTYAQSNGRAEAAVKSAKKIIAACWNGKRLESKAFAKAIINHRNTPTQKDKLSPAMKLYGHNIQDDLPAHRRSFKKEILSQNDVIERRIKHDQKMKERYDEKTTTYKELDVGTHVAIYNNNNKEFDVYGIIVEVRNRRFYIKTNSGRILVRNRRFIRRRQPLSVGQPFPKPRVTIPVTPRNPNRRSQSTPPSSHRPDTNPWLTIYTPTRRSDRPKKKTQRLIEDPSFGKRN